MRIRDYSIIIGKGKTGEVNKITDVPGVKVCHYNFKNEIYNGGITVIKPTDGYGFVNELGFTETPIVLKSKDLMLAFPNSYEEVSNALNNAKTDFLEGSIGAGVKTLGYGGIGSASRLTLLDGKYYTIGVLVQSNLGDLSTLTIDGDKVGERLKEKLEYTSSNSIVIVVATDLPVTEELFKLIIKKTEVGIANTGFNTENNVIGFSTVNLSNKLEVNNLQLDKEKLDYIFNQVADATEEAILNSLAMSNTTIYKDKTYYSLKDLYLNDYLKNKRYEAFIDNFPVMNQYPKYPVGCESVALYTLLKYYDMNITVDDIINNLKKGEKPHYEDEIMYGGDPEREFLGDPTDIYSYGVFEKPIMAVANKFKPGIKNISGTNFDKILDLVKKGYPVQVWSSIDAKTPLVSPKSWIDRKTGKTIFWKQPEHSLIIVGYSRDKVVVSDPNKGCIRELDRNAFEYAYDFFGKKALYYHQEVVSSKIKDLK